MKKFFCCVLAAVMIALGAGCGRGPASEEETGERRYEATFYDLFDTVTQVIGYAPGEADFRQTVELVYGELRQYHELFDIYNEYEGLANLKTLNDSAGGAPVEVDSRIIDLLRSAGEIYALTGGRANIAMGSVLSIWHEYRQKGLQAPESASLPPEQALEEAGRHTQIDGVEIDEAASTVRLADPAMSLDVGAFAKGFAAQRVCETLRSAGIDHLMVSVGGNVCAIGEKGDGSPWVVGIQDPWNTGSYCHTVEAVDLCVVTSGDYQRYYTVDGVDYHHIIDPDTWMPARYFASVTVLCADSALADGLSTALFTMPLEEGMALVERLQGVEALWIVDGQREEMSSGFAALMRS